MFKVYGVCFNSLGDAVTVVGDSFQSVSGEKILFYDEDFSGIREVSGLEGVELIDVEVNEEGGSDGLMTMLVNSAFTVRARVILPVIYNGEKKYLISLDDTEDGAWVITEGPGSNMEETSLTWFATDCEETESINEFWLFVRGGGY